MKPILFNTDTVRAILEDCKTVTRRVVKFLPGFNPKWTGYVPDGAVLYGSNNIPAAKAPYRPGDILYVRETWSDSADGYEYKSDYPDSDGWGWSPSIHMPREAARIFLRATDVRVERLQHLGIEEALKEGITPTNRPGGCRCSFAFDGCMEEPCSNRTAYEIGRHVEPFAQLWDSTIKKADRALYGWEANPWVWVIEFERISRKEAEK